MVTLKHQVWIDASVARVYDALSTAKNVSEWWDQQTETVRGDEVVWAHSPPPAPDDVVVALRVVERVPQRRVVWECTSTSTDGTAAAEWAGTRCSFELQKRANCPAANAAWMKYIPAQTVLDFEHSGWSESAEYASFCNSSWGAVLAELKRVCER